MAQDLTPEQEATLEYRHPDPVCEICGALADERCQRCRRFFDVEHLSEGAHNCAGRMP